MLQPSKMYHVYNRANGCEKLFRSDENYHYFISKYIKYITPMSETYAYVLMPNHFHFMIYIKSEDEHWEAERKVDIEKCIVKRFSNFFNAYAKGFNKMYNRNGSLFQRPFKYKLVEDEAYFTQLILYIHNNPVKHGYVKNLNEWPYSSIHDFVGKKGFVNIEDVLDWFGNLNEFNKAHASIENYKSVFD